MICVYKYIYICTYRYIDECINKTVDMMDLGQIKLVFFVSFVSCALPTFVPSLQNQDF